MRARTRPERSFQFLGCIAAAARSSGSAPRNRLSSGFLRPRRWTKRSEWRLRKLLRKSPPRSRRKSRNFSTKFSNLARAAIIAAIRRRAAVDRASSERRGTRNRSETRRKAKRDAMTAANYQNRRLAPPPEPTAKYLLDFLHFTRDDERFRLHKKVSRRAEAWELTGAARGRRSPAAGRESTRRSAVSSPRRLRAPN